MMAAGFSSRLPLSVVVVVVVVAVLLLLLLTVMIRVCYVYHDHLRMLLRLVRRMIAAVHGRIRRPLPPKAVDVVDAAAEQQQQQQQQQPWPPSTDRAAVRQNHVGLLGQRGRRRQLATILSAGGAVLEGAQPLVENYHTFRPQLQTICRDGRLAFDVSVIAGGTSQ